MSDPCPGCGKLVVSVARVPYCHDCGGYFDELGAAPKQAPAKKIADDRSEAEIRMAVRGVLELHGYVVVDLEQGYRPDGSTRVRKGLPDLFIMGHNRSCWAELKSQKGRQTKEQKEFEEDCHRAGFEYHLWRHEKEAITWIKQS